MPLIAIKVAIEWKLRELRRKVARARKTWLTDSAKLVRREAQQSIRKSREASEPGDPPKSKSGNLRKSIRYKVGRRDAWIGPTRPEGSHANILTVGAEHMDPRPFMGPALERARPKIRRFRSL
jgi:HK97 gp10 family phage protein